jgi:DNA-binding winged helix-turn-helix (wHTH) protein
MATRKKTTPGEKLKVIEETMFEAGKLCVGIWKRRRDPTTLRMAVSTMRTSMQAMRDQSRYKIGTTPKNGKGT